MCGLVIKGKAFMKRLWSELNEQTVYEMKNGNQKEWVTIDELMKRNKEKYFYQNLSGEHKHESVERNFRYSNGKNEANQILSVSTLRGRNR